MLGIVYILLCLITGRNIVKLLYPEVLTLGEKSYNGKELGLPRFMVAFPVFYLVGTLVLTWGVYITASLMVLLRPGMRYPLDPANTYIFIMAILFDLACLIVAIRRRIREQKKFWLPDVRGWAQAIPELLIAAVLSYFFAKMMYGTFRIEEGKLRIGLSIFSDFAVHMGMVRSFSFGNNFPTQYSHFAGEDVRYHFMFQFLVGNLEFLGMRIDHAMNLPSILSVVSAGMLLYVYGAKLFGGRLAGGLSVLFMVFRSSPSFFRYLSELPQTEDFWKEVKERAFFMNYTPNEDWGLWSLKVYTNQRHLAFGMIAVFLLLLIYTPLVFRLFRRQKKTAAKQSVAGTGAEANRMRQYFERIRSRTGQQIRAVLWDRECILPESYSRPVFCGLVLGALAFWNGAMVIGALCILFVMALASTHRLEYLITAILCMIMSVLQTQVFIHGDAVALQLLYGFIVQNKTVWGVGMYLVDLCGLLIVLTVAGILHYRGSRRWLLTAFLAPMVFAFHISLTPDVMVNHKYIMLSLILLSVMAAGLLKELWDRRGILKRIAVVLLCGIMTATGIYEVQIQKNVDEDAFEYAMDDDLIAWVREHSDSKDLWLTDWISIHEIVLGGAMLYYGWPYYAWSAGYDTYGREAVVAELFSEGDPDRMRELMKREGIRYIMVDNGARNNENYVVREDVIRDLYPVVYERGDGDWRLTIYEVEE
ncbi:MAG: hypothetical protein K6B69_03065 [Lachnospiraceae bacterium]|nr:hypothetical protein [Lachnospiraceae bacterium]